jgi:hypothetical protein
MPTDGSIPIQRQNSSQALAGSAATSFSSSPGSQFSDSRSTTGSDGDTVPSPNESVISLPIVPVLVSRQSERGLFGFNKWRRSTVDLVGEPAVKGLSGQGEERKGDAFMTNGALGIQLGISAYGDGETGEEEREEERYLTLDDI